MDKVAKFSSSILTIKSLIEEKFEDWGKVVYREDVPKISYLR
jgi:hypothetical protein